MAGGAGGVPALFPATDADTHWMRQAIALSAGVLFLTNPNPRVGCVIVKDGQVVASGATQAVGGPHAEVMALRQAQERGVDVAGSTVYVTLEPCSHFGRTPPCVDALVAARPARVVIAMSDPNPLVSGRGVARLRAAGIDVSVPVCADEALELNPGFVARMTRKTPWVWVKSAASLDGQTALANGVSQWITGPQARADGHHWRARSCVVLTGLGTVLADDPQLTVREVDTRRQPVRAVVDTHFQVPETARLFDGGRVLVFTCMVNHDKAQRLADRGVQVVVLPERDGHVDLMAVMQWLGANEFNEVHVEAGARLHGTLLQADLVDELLVYFAPMVLGPGQGMFALPGLSVLGGVQRYDFLAPVTIGPDLRVRARRADRWARLLAAVSTDLSGGHVVPAL
ncbi:bifunctional diaminohydroxyphosphoribosylaminopyrimidine deaminase/5-amino-6-(5-phosphoribosylamino)uracil reductase RibD [Pusillimonas minor]|nr:bifunctional diaminohydroxyphosphoribosylaminopyrimidine deaminase/5-amino-6-(5-phosphoribosylamino)uracil reductase RibD [Pusillimonas minor]